MNVTLAHPEGYSLEPKVMDIAQSNSRRSGGSFSVCTSMEEAFDGADVGGSSAPTFVDLDRDGDVDAFFGRKHGYLAFYRNAGSAAAPDFVRGTGLLLALSGALAAGPGLLKAYLATLR